MPKSTTRSSADEIRTAVATTIRNNFDYRNVRGLTENPTVTQNPTRQTKEPYIRVYSVGQIEIDSTKDDTPFQYHIAIEVTLRYNSYRGGQRQGEEIMNEVFSYVRGKNSSEYPDLSQYGFNVYNTTTGDTVEFTDRLRGANYYKVITALYVTASFTGQEVQVQPIQEPTFTYDTFTYTPTNNNIERYDAGNIIPAQTYISPNNGWSFSSVDYSLPANAEGVYNGTDYTLTSTNEPVAIDSTINYSMPGSLTNLLTTGARTEYNFSGDSSWYFAGSNGLILGITDGTAWGDAGIARLTVRGDIGATTLPTGTLIRVTLPNAAYIEFLSGDITISFGSTLFAINAIESSSGVIEGCSVPDLPTALTLQRAGDILTALSATTAWNRIDSIRYGAIVADGGQQPTFPDDFSTTYGLRLLSNWNVDYGVTDPQNVTITFNADKDQYAYIIVSVNDVLAGIRDSLGTNNINNFDVVTDGQYRYYISKTPILFDNSTFTYTLNT